MASLSRKVSSSSSPVSFGQSLSVERLELLKQLEQLEADIAALDNMLASTTSLDSWNRGEMQRHRKSLVVAADRVRRDLGIHC
jgi:hypothetical protein